MMEQFVTGEVQHVMTTDALESSHPISIEVRHPDEINEIFDRISYEKGETPSRRRFYTSISKPGHFLVCTLLQNLILPALVLAYVRGLLCFMPFSEMA